jgi:outer membrane protein OmpA-like peptidoglycan-associated protein
MNVSRLGIEQATGGRYVVCDTCPTRTVKTPWQSRDGSASETTRGGAASSAGQSIAAGMALGPGGASMRSNAKDNTDSNIATTASAEPLLTLRFPFDVSRIQPEHQQLLAGFASEVLPTLQRKALLVIGYTDDIGPDRYNQLLARKRADSVARALRDLGIDAVRIEAKGKCCYVADNATPQGRAQNRRAEIHLFFNQNIKEPFQ